LNPGADYRQAVCAEVGPHAVEGPRVPKLTKIMFNNLIAKRYPILLINSFLKCRSVIFSDTVTFIYVNE
jgi:hypothetical protein